MRALTLSMMTAVALAFGSGAAFAQTADPQAQMEVRKAKPKMRTHQVIIPMTMLNANGVGASIGTIVATNTKAGLKLAPRLSGLSSGPHGIHVHQNPDCGVKSQDDKVVPGLAAGGHLDPSKSGKHMGPWSMEGHQGDLPALAVDANGAAKDALVAPHLKLADLQGRSLIIHAGGDNYADQPAALGGGGARIACGVVPMMK